MSIPRSPLLIERAIDKLFDGSGPKALIARMICRDGRLTKKTLPKLEEALKEEFPKEFKAMKRDLISLVSEIEKSLCHHFDQKKVEAVLGVERVVAAKGIVAYFVGDYPREMVCSGSFAQVKDIEVFSTDSRAVSLFSGLDVIVNQEFPDESMTPYMSLAGCEDSPFNRFAFSRGVTIDSLGIRVGTNEILDPSKRGVSDSLAGRVSSTLPPRMAVASSKPIAFKAIRIACQTGFVIDEKFRSAIKTCKGKFGSVPNERVLIEKYILSKTPATATLALELGIGDI